jgi:tetratricopeptide (TPR) repeat protein
MKIKKLTTSFLLLALLAGCNPLKQLQTHQASIKNAFEAGNYSEVLVNYEKLKDYHSSKGSEVKTEYLKMAAESAVKLERYPMAEELLQEWLDRDEDFEAVKMLANVYEQTGKTDKEYKLWNRYWEKIESPELKKEVGQKLFAIEMEQKEYDKALDRAKEMPPMNDPRIVFLRVKALEATDKKEEARSLCNTLLEKNSDFKPALEWKAKDLYEQAENWYKAEMREYNKDPNYTAYVYLKRELKKISAMYRQSRDIFEKLHQEDPDNQLYIKYLKNIYLRLEMNEEAAKMDMLLENQR